LIVITANSPFGKSLSNEGPVQRRAFSVGRYFTRRPLKKPAFVVFCLILAVSPCSAIFTSAFVFRHLFAYFGIVTGALMASIGRGHGRHFFVT
jgi:hypothetical protein